MLVSPLICENLRAFFTPKSCIIEHVPDQINYSYFLELISAMRTMAIAPGLPFIDAALAGKNLALTTAYHVLHNVSTDRADELFNLLTVFINHIIGSQSLCRACYFLLSDSNRGALSAVTSHRCGTDDVDDNEELDQLN